MPEKCFCCPPKLCTDNGCKDKFGGEGECRDMRKLDYSNLEEKYDLSASGTKDDNQTCLSSDPAQKDCCRCLKKFSCQDDGCSQEFGGLGICVDITDVDLANLTNNTSMITTSCQL